LKKEQEKGVKVPYSKEREKQQRKKRGKGLQVHDFKAVIRLLNEILYFAVAPVVEYLRRGGQGGRKKERRWVGCDHQAICVVAPRRGASSFCEWGIFSLRRDNKLGEAVCR